MHTKTQKKMRERYTLRSNPLHIIHEKQLPKRGHSNPFNTLNSIKKKDMKDQIITVIALTKYLPPRQDASTSHITKRGK